MALLPKKCKATWAKWPKPLEARVIEAIAQGMSAREIAQFAQCSAPTILKYKREIFPQVQATALKLQTSPFTEPNNALTNGLSASALTVQPMLDRLAERETERRKVRDSTVTKRDAKGYAALSADEYRDMRFAAELTGLLNTGSPMSVAVCLVVQDRSPQAGFTTRLQSPAEPIQDETIGNSAIIDVTAERR